MNWVSVASLSDKDCTLALNNTFTVDNGFALVNCEKINAHFFRNFASSRSNNFLATNLDDGNSEAVREVNVIGWYRHFYSTTFDDNFGSPEVQSA